MKIKNTNVNGDHQYLVIERDSGNNFTAEVMMNVYIGFPFSFEGSIERAVANLVPTKSQLQSIMSALKDGAIKLYDLDGVGGLYGGVSHIDIPAHPVPRRKNA